MNYQTVVLDVEQNLKYIKQQDIIEKYGRDNNGYYMRHRYDENEKEFYVDQELKEYFEDNNITYDISIQDGFDSPGYAVDFMAVTFEYEGNLCLRTVVFEYM